MSEGLKMILTADEIARIKSRISGNKTNITVDLHQMTVRDAKRLLKNIIAIDRNCSGLHVIHGYKHGTSIKSMIFNDLESPRIIKKATRKDNPGFTDIALSC